MKRNTKIIGLLAIVFTIASCTSTQYGYDDVYDHDYPVAQVATKTNSNTATQKQYYNDNSSYNSYEEEDYTNYNSNNGYNSGSGYYTNRIDRFYRPSFSVSYYSPGFSTYGYGNNGYYNQNYYYNSSPFYGYNSYFSNPYDWHIHHYHHSQLWGNSYGYNSYNPWYGYGNTSYYCPPNYGYGYSGNNYQNYNPYYGNSDGYQSNPSGNSVYYGPRPNYQKNDSQAQPKIQTTFGADGQIKNETKTYGNGVKVNTQYKPTPQQTTTPTPSSTPKNNNYTAPKVTPRYNTKPTPSAQPKPSYTPQPRPSYSKPKTTVKPSGSSYSTPKTNQSSGVKVKATKKE